MQQESRAGEQAYRRVALEKRVLMVRARNSIEQQSALLHGVIWRSAHIALLPEVFGSKDRAKAAQKTWLPCNAYWAGRKSVGDVKLKKLIKFDL